MTIPKDLYQTFDETLRFQGALERVIELTQQPTRKIIGIAGLPGSGKSTLADYLAMRINNGEPSPLVASVSMDGFHLSKTALLQLDNPAEALKRRGAPWTFDSVGFCRSLQNFKQHPNNTLFWPSFDHAIGDPIVDAISIPSDIKVLIVEGLYVLHDDHGFEAGTQYLDQRWFIDLPFEVAMHQLAKRHQRVWGITADQAQQRILANDSLNAHIAYQSRQYADLHLSSD